MTRHMLIRASVARPVPALIEDLGVSAGPILLRAGLPADVADWGDLAIRQTQLETLLECAAKATGEIRFGARVGPLALDGYGPLAKALRSGGRVGDILARAIALAVPAVREGVRIGIDLRGGEAWYVETPVDRLRPRLAQLSDASAAMMLHALRLHLGEGWTPLMLRLPHADPRERARLEDLLRAPVSFAPDHCPAIGLRATDLARMSRLRPAAVSARTGSADRMREDEMQVVATRILRGMVLCGDIGLKAVAATLGVSPRSLQARLTSDGSSFQDLVERIRADLALSMLAESRIAITRIAHLLNYGDGANFTRAFRRWYGVPPSAVRADPGLAERLRLSGRRPAGAWH